MNLERLFYCALSAGLLAYGLGCGDDGSPSGPTIPSFDQYSVTPMANGRVQVYGNTQYEFEVECHDSELVIQRSSSADAVWFGWEITTNQSDIPQKNVTITPAQDESWSAKVTFKCSNGSSSEASVVNFCYQGPCSDEDKP